MTVGELIDQLHDLPREMPVVLCSMAPRVNYPHAQFDDAFLRRVNLAPKVNGRWPKFTRLTHRNTIEAVVIE